MENAAEACDHTVVKTALGTFVAASATCPITVGSMVVPPVLFANVVAACRATQTTYCRKLWDCRFRHRLQPGR